MGKLKFPITPEMHEAIVRIYQTSTGGGQVRALARKLGYPRWAITRHAIMSGLIAKQKKEPDWMDKEIHILELNAHRSPVAIQKRLIRAGFNRSLTGIILKRKRMRFLQNLDGESATSLGECLGVDQHFVTEAIRGGKLKAERRETQRTEKQGGDMWFIRNRNIRTYILNWLNEIDIRKVDKYWFVDLLTGKY
jgi:hypothetical protein